MKICFNALSDITNEISHKIYQKHGWNPQDSLRKTVYVNDNVIFTSLSKKKEFY